jgi:hypothetical protein
VIDEKKTLIDTVKFHLCDEMLERIKSVMDPSQIDYIVSNHVEMDHSGAIPLMKKIAPGAAVITSPNGQKGLAEHYGPGLDLKPVNAGDTLNTGQYTSARNASSFQTTPSASTWQRPNALTTNTGRTLSWKKRGNITRTSSSLIPSR